LITNGFQQLVEIILSVLPWLMHRREKISHPLIISLSKVSYLFTPMKESGGKTVGDAPQVNKVSQETVTLIPSKKTYQPGKEAFISLQHQVRIWKFWFKVRLLRLMEYSVSLWM